MTNRFRKIAVKNDWEYLTYHWSTKSGKKAFNEKLSGKALIKWPNGAKESVEFSSVKTTVEYSDHGHLCSTVQYRPVIKAMLNGLEVTVPLEALLVASVAQL
jgi:hypothetical protein